MEGTESCCGVTKLAWINRGGGVGLSLGPREDVVELCSRSCGCMQLWWAMLQFTPTCREVGILTPMALAFIKNHVRRMIIGRNTCKDMNTN